MTAFIIAALYYFKEIISGNMDLMYLLAGILMIESLLKKRKLFGQTIFIYLPIFIWAAYQSLLIENINILKLVVNITKIFICIFLFNYTKQNLREANIGRITRYISIFFVLSIPICLIFKTQRLWSLNDVVNKYSQVRLKLFYFEPSELSFQVCILAIALAYFILHGDNVKTNLALLLGVFPIAIMSYGFGGIMFLCISLFIMSMIYMSRNLDSKNFIKAYSLFVLFFTGIAITFYAGSAFIKRATDIFSGNDGSVMYRLNIGWEVMLKALQNTRGIGLGFGNLNTNLTQNIYSAYGLVDVIANSFMYFIAEGGVFAILYILIFHIAVFRKVDREYLMIKLPLLVFIILYQIAGGYFTNPMNWVVYGIICSDLRGLNKVSVAPAKKEKVNIFRKEVPILSVKE